MFELWNKTGLAKNPISGTVYKNGNQMLLASYGFDDPRHMTFKQAQDNGLRIKKGAKGRRITKLVEINKREKTSTSQIIETSDSGKVKVMVPHVVFNACDVEGLDPYCKPLFDAKVPEIVSSLFMNWKNDGGPSIDLGGDGAFYSVDRDHIQLPLMQNFNSLEYFLSVLIHEGAHATGHPLRLNRDIKNRFATPEYAKEEIRAELSSAFLCAELGITRSNNDREHNAAYIKSWIKALKDDKTELFKATKDAHKIMEYLTKYTVDLIPGAQLFIPEYVDNKYVYKL
jgi:antirestriction protein ArdC